MKTMKTMITRNNVLRHNGTMRCLLGRNGPWEFQVITPRHGLLLRGSEQKHAGAGGKPVEVVEVVGKRVEDREGVGRGAGRLGEVRKAMGKCGRGGKAWEVTVHCTWCTSAVQMKSGSGAMVGRRRCISQHHATLESGLGAGAEEEQEAGGVPLTIAANLPNYNCRQQRQLHCIKRTGSHCVFGGDDRTCLERCS